MRLQAVELRRVTLRLVEPFRTAHGTTGERDVLVLRLRTDEGDGWAECAATPAPTYTAEHVDGAHRVLRDHLLPRLWGADLTAAGLGVALSGVAGHPMAKAALEVAVLDVELRAAGRSLAAWSGAVHDRVPGGVAVGLVGDIDALVAAVAARVAEGYGRVKVKIAPGFDVDPLRAVRAAVGDGVVLVADANGSYTLDDAPRLSRLDDVGLTCLEQPLGADRLLDHVELARRIATPVCLDEAITSAAVARDALRLGACAVVCLKPARVGGVVEARRVHDVCVEAGAGLTLGGMLETALGRPVVLALAAMAGCTLPGDQSAGGRWYADDLGPPEPLVDGTVAVPGAPGCAPPPDAVLLERATVSVEELRPPDSR